MLPHQANYSKCIPPCLALSYSRFNTYIHYLDGPNWTLAHISGKVSFEPSSTDTALHLNVNYYNLAGKNKT